MEDYKECTDCVHYEFCLSQEKYLIEHNRKDLIRRYGFGLHEVENCKFFKDRSRFVELPCKVGDTAWVVVRYKNGDGHFYTGIVTGVHVTDRKTIYKLPCKRFNYIVIRFVQTDSLKHINFNEIGKTVFFTKEAAEQALKERENDG